MGDGTKDEEVPLGSTKESLGKIDFDAGVPLDREEEIARKVGSLSAAGDEGPQDSALDLLFRTQLRELQPKAPVTVQLGASVAEACQRMREDGSGYVLVLEGEKLVGIFTEADVVEKATTAAAPGGGLDRTPVNGLMKAPATTLRPNQRIAHALNAMTRDRSLHVPLVDEKDRPVGVISARRIVDFLSERFPQKLLNMPPDPDQAMPRREGG
jgi:CBS domain-containing protein